MSSPKASISVPQEKEQQWDNSIELFLEETGMKGKPNKLSTLVWKMVLESYIVDKAQLAEFSTKENLKTAEKKYIVIAL